MRERLLLPLMAALALSTAPAATKLSGEIQEISWRTQGAVLLHTLQETSRNAMNRFIVSPGQKITDSFYSAEQTVRENILAFFKKLEQNRKRGLRKATRFMECAHGIGPCDFDDLEEDEEQPSAPSYRKPEPVPADRGWQQWSA